LVQTEQDLKELLPPNIHPDDIAVTAQSWRMNSRIPLPVALWGSGGIRNRLRNIKNNIVIQITV
jgi:hypothetical protein